MDATDMRLLEYVLLDHADEVYIANESNGRRQALYRCGTRWKELSYIRPYDQFTYSETVIDYRWILENSRAKYWNHYSLRKERT